MPRDGFYEESAISQRSRSESKVYTAFKVIAIVLFTVSGLALVTLSPSYVASVYAVENATTLDHIVGLTMWFGLFVALIGTGLIFWFFKNRFNVSYDYTFVEDELRITKVFNGKKRKFLTTLKADRMLQIGWVEKNSYEKMMLGMKRSKPKICTPNKQAAEGKELIYILYSSSMEKSVYVLEVRRQLLENLVYAAGRNKLERE